MNQPILAALFCVLFFCFAPINASSFSEISTVSPVSDIDTVNKAEKYPLLAAMNIDLQASSTEERQYLPTLGRDIYSKTETYWHLRSRLNFDTDKYLSFAWQESAIEQRNELFGDTDFSIESRGPAFGLGFPLMENGTVNAELRIEEYQDVSTGSFYKLKDSISRQGFSGDYFYSGFIESTFAMDSSWATISYKRSRDTEPVYDQLTNRAELNIRAEEISGLAAGWKLDPGWEIGSSVFYEQYEGGTPDQFNLNGALDYRPLNLKSLHFSFGSGYYTEEQETIVNFSADYLYKWQYADLAVQYQCEYSDNENSLLHQGDVLLKFYLNQKASLFVRGEYGEETGDDRDRFSSVNGGIELLF